MIEQAEEEEITSQSEHFSDDDDNITPTESEEEMSLLEREEILDLIKSENEKLRQQITDE